MNNEIIVNAERGETRVALLEGSSFTELHIERGSDRNVMGSVILGRVSRVLPGMQAAFVDIGLEKAAFLYAGDYIDTKSQTSGGDDSNPRRRRGNGRSHIQIDAILKEGQEIVVQIAKEPIGTKGARITSQISIPGRHLVLTPGSSRVGVSRRIGSDRERRRLREIVDKIRPEKLGFIIRTAGDGVRDADLEADVRYLTKVWKTVQRSAQNARAPKVLYAEPELALRMIRDLSGPDTKRIAIDSAETYRTVRAFVDEFVAEPRPHLEHYEGQTPIFDHFGLESQIQANLERRVFLKSGASLIIDQSEALTSIDVNTGRFVGRRNLEETVLKTNLEAVKEIAHQLRFRNIGGIVILDLIDMESASNRDRVYRALAEALRQDKARTNILKISELGLVEMTRKRTRENLVQTLCEPCPYCEGRSYVLSSESVAFSIIREVRKDLPRFSGRQIAISVNPSVAEALLAPENEALADLGSDLGFEIEVRARPGLHQEQFEVQARGRGEPVVIPLRWLAAGDEPAAEPEVAEAAPEEAVIEAEKSPEITLEGLIEAPLELLDDPEMPEIEPEIDAAVAPEADAAVTPEADAAPEGDAEADPDLAEVPQPLDDAAESPILPPVPEAEEN